MPRQLDVLKMQVETSWGVTPTSAWTYLPFDQYAVSPVNSNLLMETHSGFRDAGYIGAEKQTLSGNAVFQVWPDFAELLLDLIGIGTDMELPSYAVMWYDSTRQGTITHLGLKTESAIIRASNANPFLSIEANLIGRQEVAAGTIGAATFPQGRPLRFNNATFTVDGISEGEIESFEISLQNNPESPEFHGYAAGETEGMVYLKALDGTLRKATIRWEMTVSTALAVNYRGLLRDLDNDMVIEMVFDAEGTGSPYDTLTLTLPKIQLVRADIQGPMRMRPSMLCEATVSREDGQVSPQAAIVATLA